MTAHLCIINGYLQSSVAIWDQADPNAYFFYRHLPSFVAGTRTWPMFESIMTRQNTSQTIYKQAMLCLSTTITA